MVWAIFIWLKNNPLWYNATREMVGVSVGAFVMRKEGE
jgi:hypothetical protein